MDTPMQEESRPFEKINFRQVMMVLTILNMVRRLMKNRQPVKVELEASTGDSPPPERGRKAARRVRRAAAQESRRGRKRRRAEQVAEASAMLYKPGYASEDEDEDGGDSGRANVPEELELEEVGIFNTGQYSPVSVRESTGVVLLFIILLIVLRQYFKAQERVQELQRELAASGRAGGSAQTA